MERILICLFTQSHLDMAVSVWWFNVVALIHATKAIGLVRLE